MVARKNRNTWVVLADGAQVRIVETNGAARWKEVTSWESSEAHRRSRGLTSDKMGRTFSSARGGPRHAFKPRTDAHTEAKKVFVHDVAQHIDTARKRGVFDAIVLVAPPVVLGQFRRALPRGTAAKVAREVKKDLTNTPLDALPEHLPGLLEPMTAARGR